MDRKEIVLEGKELDETIDRGLLQISKSREEVDIEVFEKEKSFFGKVKLYQVKIGYYEQEEQVEDEKMEEIETLDSEPSFYIDYLDDGVYMSLLEGGERLDLMTIFEIISKYGIKDIIFSDIKKGFSQYGGIPFKIAPAQERETPESGFLTYTSEDKMKGFIMLFENNEKGAREILEELQGIFKIGVDYVKLEKAVEERLHNRPVLIAEGVPPVEGKDGYVDYKFDIESATSPKVKEDGTVDFKDLELFNNVEADSVIAELVSPQDGKDGQDVFGATVAFKAGKYASFKYGKNIEEIDGGRSLVSKVDGQVKLEDGKLNIYEIYEVRGNVDNSVGNIDFKGSVKIKGNILTGFTVKCKGDLEVEGVVESAVVDCEGDIFIKKGILGSDNCEVKAKGSIYSRYIESAYVFSEKVVESEMILHSEIVSRGDVVASGKKGVIMGGRIRAKSEVRAKVIGAVMATPTLIEVGVDPHIKQESDLLRKAIDSLEADIYKLEQVITHLKGSYDRGILDEKKQGMYLSAIETKSDLEKRLEDAVAMADRNNYEKQGIRGRVVFEDIVHPGVRIVMGTSVYQVDEDIVHSTIYKDHFDGEIKIGPFIDK